MDIGILVIDTNDYISSTGFDLDAISYMLENRGYDVRQIVFANAKTDLLQTAQYLKSAVQSVIVCGNVGTFCEAFSETYNLSPEQKVVEFDGVVYAFMPKYSKEFVIDRIIPALNSKSKTFYNTIVFKTFGKTEAELREMLKEQIRNKNRISFRFFETYPECTVKIKYSSKTSKPVVDSIIASSAEILQDVTYAHEDVSIAARVAEILKTKQKTVCVAESFTGGGVTNALVKIEGISSVLKEGLVTYMNEAKIKRLNIDPTIIETYGAVSVETVYEMAANAIMESNCDYSLATTGNAGPTAEKDGDVGVCFIAVGTPKAVDIYKFKFDGDREYVMDCGVKAALFRLYKKLIEIPAATPQQPTE